MNLFVSGVSFRKTPVDVREKLYFGGLGELEEALGRLRGVNGVDGCTILSTCNRTEAYIYSRNDKFDYSLIEDMLCEIKDLNPEIMRKYFYTYCGQKAMDHIFKVASSMDSMVPGEDQILGQFKEALRISIRSKAGSSVLNSLLQRAVTAAKKIKTEYMQERDFCGIADTAVKLISDSYKEAFRNKTILIIGSGRIGIIGANQLAGAKKVYLTKRKHIPEDVSKHVTLIRYEDRYDLIDECDAVISATKSSHYTITKDMLTEHINDMSKTRLFLDLAVPGDIEPGIAALKNVVYYNIDDHEEVFKRSTYINVFQNDSCEAVIEKHIRDFKKWLYHRSMILQEGK